MWSNLHEITHSGLQQLALWRLWDVCSWQICLQSYLEMHFLLVMQKSNPCEYSHLYPFCLFLHTFLKGLFFISLSNRTSTIQFFSYSLIYLSKDRKVYWWFTLRCLSPLSVTFCTLLTLEWWCTLLSLSSASWGLSALLESSHGVLKKRVDALSSFTQLFTKRIPWSAPH